MILIDRFINTVEKSKILVRQKSLDIYILIFYDLFY